MFNFNSINKWIKSIFKWKYEFSPGTKKLFWGIIFILSVTLVLTIDLIPNQIDLKVGQVSKNDIYAPNTKIFVDDEKTERQREIAAQSASRVYEEDINVNNNIKEKIQRLFTSINNYPTDNREENTSNEIIINIKKEFGQGLSDTTIKVLFDMPAGVGSNLENAAISIMDKKMQEKIMPGDIPVVKDELAQEAMKLDLAKEYRLALADILENMVRPNMILNKEATQERQEEAMKKVKPVTRTVRQGETIIRKGDVVTEDDIKVLEALGLQKTRVNYLNIIGIIATIIIIVIMASLYFIKYQREVWDNQKKMVLLELLIIIILVLAKVIDVFQVNFQVNYLLYLVPIAMVSILSTVFIGTEIAVVLSIFLSFLVAIVFNFNYNIALTGFISSLVGIYSVSKLSQRNDLVRAGFNVSAVLLFFIPALALAGRVSGLVNYLWYMAMGILNGITVAILSNGLLPYLENGFGLTSSVKLLELSNPSQPLLKRLLVEAPGTYHHCVIVGNLAETAADNVGADSLLARIGAYYHDIGKMKRPYFFTENHFGEENPHDKISANLSALIIKSHVKDGVELAREYRLPEAIIDIIKQHHATNLISYFYQQALNDSIHDSVEENDFRYDGPKPQSREAAIIMLADIVEAATRSKGFTRNDHNRMEGFVRELIRDKLIEGQLNECDLSLKDLDIIAESFGKVLSGIYHQRVEYPENLLKEMKRADKSDKHSSK